VDAVQRRLAALGVALVGHREILCCYSRQAKVWLDDPAGARWEAYTVVEDTEDESEPGFAPDASRLRARQPAGAAGAGPRLRRLARRVGWQGSRRR